MGPREAVLDRVAAIVLALGEDRIRRVAVDGVDGAGKTVFADELGAVLTARGAAVVRASVDGFHQPRAARHARGRSSPEGFFRDSYDYGALRRLLLDPLGPGGDRRVVRAVHNVRAERAVEPVTEVAPASAILVLDGIFLHRPELRGCWDRSVFLDVDFAVSVPRLAGRDGGDPDPDAAANRRYVEGQRIYLAECAPRAAASVVIDHTDLAHPVILREP